MPYIGPWSNFHELNLDWLLREVKQLRTDLDGLEGASIPSDDAPEMDGVASPGSAVSYSRGDHVHPTDTSRASAADLIQEATDRGDADNALNADILAVDAKIKFSAAAPLMDSSSASAGFSDYMARADHVHPTDTSRASATDLATLSARVDAFSGSANPYDIAPLMDGAANAGTVGAYSRGDHVHPSDTSKLDTAGGTISGDLDIEGVLSETRKERHFTSDSTGWVRVATVPQVQGTRCVFTIVRKGTIAPAETHEITLAILQNSIKFQDERSAADVLYIDKIRYSNAGAVDIHIDQNAASAIGVFADIYAPTAADVSAIALIQPSGVSDAPAGETILKEDVLHTATMITTGDWCYEILNDGYVRLTGSDLVTFTTSTVYTNFHRGTGQITLPIAFSSVNNINTLAADGHWTSLSYISGTTLQLLFYNVVDGTFTSRVYVDIIGKL